MPTVGSFRQSHRASCRGLGRARNSRYVRADSGWLPDQRRLVLPDDWPEDMHPLAKMRWIIDCALNRRLIPKRTVYQ